jgi:hypothetical protein
MPAKISLIRFLVAPMLMVSGFMAQGQTTAGGTVNAILIHKSGISLVFDTNSAGVSLGGNGTSASTLNLGTISAFGALTSGVTRSTVTSNSFTVGTLFNIQVVEGGLSSNSYSLAAQLAAASPAGFSFAVDGVALTTASHAIQTTATYNTNVQHTLNLTVLTAAPGAGGPAVGTPLTTTLNFTATAN